MHGFIAYRDSRLNPRTIYFYSSSDVKEPRKINPSDIKGFIVDREQPYISFRCSINTEPTELKQLLYSNDRHFGDVNEKNDTVFLRVLATGQINLYELEDFKYHYFIQYNEGPVLELLNKFYMMQGPPEYKVNNRIYLHQLDSFLVAHNITGKPDDLQSIAYNEDELVKLVKHLNGFTGNNSIVSKIYKARTKQNRFGVGGGISIVHFSDNDAMFTEIRSTGVSPLFNLYYDFTGIATLNKFFGRVALQGQKEKIGKTTQTLTNMSFIPSANYSVIKKSLFEMYAGVAPCININLNNSSWEEHPVKKVWANLNMHAGLILRKKWDINVSYDCLYTPEEAQISGGTPGFKLNILSVKLNYLFSL